LYPVIKCIVKLPKTSQISSEEFHEYWLNNHGPLCVRVIPGLRKYSQNHLVKSVHGEAPDFGWAEIWFDDMDAYNHFKAWRENEASKELLRDEDKFIDASGVEEYVVEEHHIL